MPVELSAFSGQVREQQVILNWTTASEKNNAYFEVLKSDDGKNFYAIGQVSGSGTTQQVSHYQYNDADFGGQAYFRLKQVDYDGSTDYSHTVFVSTEKATRKPSFAPNPYTQGSTFNLFTYSGNEAATVNLYSINGQQILQTTGNDTYLQSAIQNKLASLEAGLYIMEVSTGTQNNRMKLMVK